MIETIEDLKNIVTSNYPQVNLICLSNDIKKVRKILDKWKLRVRIDIYDYLLNAEDYYKEE